MEFIVGRKKEIIIKCVWLVVSLMMICGCGHKHTWKDATCLEPQICEECGETQGEALGHSFKDATCQSPATCERCGETQGDVIEHDFADATCTVAKKCKMCGMTDGKPTGHISDCTATFLNPEVCTVCGEVLADRIESFLEEEGWDITPQGDVDLLFQEYSRNKETNIVYKVENFIVPSHISVTEIEDSEDEFYKYVIYEADLNLENWSFDYQSYSIYPLFFDRYTGSYIYEYDSDETSVLQTRTGNINVGAIKETNMSDDYLSERDVYKIHCPKDYNDIVFGVFVGAYEIGSVTKNDEKDAVEKKVHVVKDYDFYKHSKQNGIQPVIFSVTDR